MRFEVTCGNIGSVYRGNDFSTARSVYQEYVRQSGTPGLRATLEVVIIWEEGEPYKEFYPEIDLEPEQLAKAHGVFDSCDFAMPITWFKPACKTVDANLGGHVVWNYGEGDGLCGKPFGLTELGRRAISKMEAWDDVEAKSWT